MLNKLIEKIKTAAESKNITKQKVKLIVILAIEFIAIALVLVLIFFSGKKSYTVTFDLDGGILISGDLEQRVIEGHNATPPSVAKHGHYLRGWSGSYNSVTRDITVKAIWEYQTSPGIEYSIPSNTNYCEISSSFKDIQGEIFIGAYHNDRKVLGIKSGAFKDRTGITSVHLLDGILAIESEAFSGCSSLETIDIPSTVVRIGKNAFKNCESLTTIILPEGMTSIAEGAFEGCTSLTTIIIPESLEEIPANCFKGCTSLTEVIITNGVVKINSGAFAGCESLTEIYLPRSLRKIDSGAFDTTEMIISFYALEEEMSSWYMEGWCPEDTEFLYGVDREEDAEPIVDEEIYIPPVVEEETEPEPEPEDTEEEKPSSGIVIYPGIRPGIGGKLDLEDIIGNLQDTIRPGIDNKDEVLDESDKTEGAEKEPEIEEPEDEKINTEIKLPGVSIDKGEKIPGGIKFPFDKETEESDTEESEDAA